MTLEDKVRAFRLHVLQRVEELGNVSAGLSPSWESRARCTTVGRSASTCTERTDFIHEKQQHV